ncbi:acyl-CoA dehydrogenase family protein [Actinoplanes sp. M2I2]|uniref:acyl-CoA dehydrogenase family protein n=1 Tax=Actinoplanes sp. M2I2 TaxID=1734444 RepID=UPI002021F81D|nr:acyl-CoA dehydrogenase family protein [Actinoplanes sp. M2I2]
MIETLTANADRTEHQSRPTTESLRAAREAGAFALGTPREYGGAGASATEVSRLLTDMGRACPSTSWIAGTCLTAKVLSAVVVDFDETARAEFFGDPDALFCGSGKPGGTGVREGDGVRVSGRWATVSGCEDAEWAGLAAMVDGDFSLVQIPTGSLRIEQTWSVAGMRGTGSHTVVAEDVLVPAGNVGAFQFPPGAIMQLFGLSVLAPMVGATFGALDVVHTMFASDRKPFMTAYNRMNESPGARHWLAEATMLARRAERTMLAVAAEADSGAELTAADNSRLHLDLAEAARDCRSAMERLLDLHGSSGFGTSNPLQRFWRDVAVGSRHAHLNGYLAMEGYGRVVSGVE